MKQEKNKPTEHDKEALNKAFVNGEGITTIACPECGSVKTVSAERFRNLQHHLKVRCTCTHVFKVNLDFRQSYRKATDLQGVYKLLPPASGGGKAQIKDLSIKGIRFEVNGPHTIDVGYCGRIDFTLDDKKKTRLIRDCIVRSVRGAMIGCEFKEDKLFEKELGFYLRFGP